MTRRIASALLMLLGTGAFVLGASRPWAEFVGGAPPHVIRAGTVDDLRVPVGITVLIILGVATGLFLADGAVYRLLGLVELGAVAFLAFAVDADTDPMLLGGDPYDLLDGPTIAWIGFGILTAGGLLALLLPPHAAEDGREPSRRAS